MLVWPGVMAKMVVQQPQAVAARNMTNSSQWSSGVFDCCDNVAECESGYINVSIYFVMMFKTNKACIRILVICMTSYTGLARHPEAHPENRMNLFLCFFINLLVTVYP